MSFKSAEQPRRVNDDIDNEIADLEHRLEEAKLKRQQLASLSQPQSQSHAHSPTPAKPLSSPLLTSPAAHFLLLLSDSALPLGSFAFSSGLESYLAHQKLIFSSSPPSRHQQHHQPPASFASFLPLSVSSYASTTLPFVLAAHRDPSLASLAALDDALDASIVCTVGRRASVAQGRALLSIWERSFAGAATGAAGGGGGDVGERRKGEEALKGFAGLLRASSSGAALNGGGNGNMDGSGPGGDGDPPAVAAHLAPLFGAVCALVGLGLEQTAYVFMLGHVKALVSAAVRAGMFGPYQAQKTLASGTVQGLITAMIEREWQTKVEEAGQNVPVMDLWVGRHEVLYSRIFNS